MEKLVYVVWKREGASPAAFKGDLLGEVAKRFGELGVHGMTINVADEHIGEAVSARLTKLAPPLDGLVSFWIDSADDRAPYEESLAAVTSRTAGYLVVESVPIVNTAQKVPLGERTPGINMLACLERPARLSWDAWIEHWHGHHRKVALETQCTFHYVRNVVVRALTESCPPWEGIVEEGFPREAIGDPMVWYRGNGSKEVFERNLARMIESCQAFLDLDRVESHPLSEYRLSEPGSGGYADQG